MRILDVLVTACALAAVVSAGRLKRQSELECRDARNRTGTCGSIEECDGLSWIVEAGRRPTPIEFNFLKKSVCGRTKTRVHICCAPSSSQPPPEDHPNKHLVEQGKLCGTIVHQRIRGGDEVPIGKHPWMAVLFYRDLITGSIRPGCGGALISQQHVLTAAHCVTDLGDAELMFVRLGEHDLTSREDCQQRADGSPICNHPQNFRINASLFHEGYSRINSSNDIALIKLDRPVLEDDFVGKICLPFGIAGHRDYTGVNLTAAGYGRLGPSSSSPSSQVLMEVRLPGVDQRVCSDVITRNKGVITDKQICAGGEDGRDSCDGDSGGPLIAPTPTGPPYSLVGVVSFGAVRCGEGGVPSVNTRVSEYLNWILDRLD
ncbi:Phenoloxidase-activating factor 3 [Amphibalanus amphitrite]|uniref:CLIP domain-containing serine protease n=1 Tax=Amphibalanus amphitrite TaxID=1232801 RepID=A0A6A4X823_AMPAM|nr:Phenoloxidase-activating factor 3 [Amphibalanus amphitrite]